MKRPIRCFVLALFWCAIFSAPAAAQWWEDGGSTRGSSEPSTPAKSAQAAEERPIRIPTEQPMNDFTPSDFSRFVGDDRVDFGRRIDLSLIVFIADHDLGKDDIAKIEEVYSITFAKKLGHGALLFSTKPGTALEDVIKIANDVQHNSSVHVMTPWASPALFFTDGTKYFTGRIVIEWSPTVSKKRAFFFTEQMGLKTESYDPDTHITVASTTEKSGFNVLNIALAFGPWNGNFYVLDIEPEYAAIEPPVTVEGRVEPAGGKGYPGDIAGSAFRFVLTIVSRPGVLVRVNELKTTSETFKTWLPKRAKDQSDVSPQVFDLEGAENISEATVEETVFRRDRKGRPVKETVAMRVTTIVYRFRMSLAGSFVLASPKILYDLPNPQTKKTDAESIDGSAASFLVGTILPEEADTVNDVVGFSRPQLQNPFPGGRRLRHAAFSLFGFAAAVLLLFTGIQLWQKVALSRVAIPDNATLALDAWKSGIADILSHLPASPKQFWQVFADLSRQALSMRVTAVADAFDPKNPDAIADACKGFCDARTLAELRTLLDRARENALNPESPESQSFSRESGEELLRSTAELLRRMKG